ncbi:MAG: hypothetical protein QME60_04510 [Verrucomicrobiota bacterium]|nr:hypothetical protein [Verrucomicrobiota bacterium]
MDRVPVSFNPREFRAQVITCVDWYARFRPHQGLDGKTPEALCSPSATAAPARMTEPPVFDVRGPEAVKLDLLVTHHRRQSHLPIVELRKAA